MSEGISKLFIDPKDLPQGFYGDVQVLFLGAIYGYVLFNASNLISDGSEYLLLVPALAGIVGSVVLPILGAVPDGAIVLFSGMGPKAQEQLQVGVGALAGSTIMLLTIPWALSIIAGRVSIDEHGHGNYKRPKHADKTWTKLNPPGSLDLFKTGVVGGKEISMNGKMMVLTSLIYLVIQIPAFATTGTKYQDAHADTRKVAIYEQKYAMVGLIFCVIAFVGYLYWNIKKSSTIQVDVVDEVRVQAIRSGDMSLSGLMTVQFATLSSSFNYGTIAEHPVTEEQYKRLEVVLRPFFQRYDVNRDGRMDKDEVRLFFKDLNENISAEDLDRWFAEADSDNSGFIEFRELVDATVKYLQAIVDHNQRAKEGIHTHGIVHNAQDLTAMQTFGTDDDGDEEEEIPEDLAHLSVEEQQRAIKFRACWMMLLGTALVLLFSDPMVDVLGEIGNRSGIPSFYISFVLAPLASNASELIASYNYALKKTSKTITISFSALLGAACMNNTFCLGIFMALMYFTPGGLAWEFSAETLSILMVELVMGFIALKKTHRLIDAILVMSLYPLSIATVFLLENVAGLD